MLCNCVLIEAAVIRQEESADPAVISCCIRDKQTLSRKSFPGRGAGKGRKI